MQNGLVATVERACTRAASVVHLKMSRGITSLATIASTAAFLGAMGTLLGIAYSFRGTTGSKILIMAAAARQISWALMPTGLGLIVALSAFCGTEYVASNLQAIDVEMKNGTLELLNELARLEHRSKASDSI